MTFSQHHTAPAVLVEHAAGSILVPVVVQNTGNVRLDSVSILGQSSCLLSTLEPQQSARCNSTTAVVQDDFDAGKVVVSAKATAVPRGSNTTVSGVLWSSKVVMLDQAPSMQVTASANASNATIAGELCSKGTSMRAGGLYCIYVHICLAQHCTSLLCTFVRSAKQL